LVGYFIVFCFTWLLISIVAIFTVLCPYVIYDWGKEQAGLLKGAEKYSAEIVDRYAESYKSSQTKRVEERYYPIYRFVTATGDTITIQADGTDIGRTDIGEIRTVYYNAQKEKIVTIDATTAILPIGMLFLFIPLVALSFGFFFYCFGGDMKKYKKYVVKRLLIVYLSAIIIAFYALLIYAFLYGYPAKGEEGYWIVKPFLILVIALLTWCFYLVIKKSLSKNKKLQTKNV